MEPRTFIKCHICGRYGWLGTHQCPPQWDVAKGESLLHAGEEECWKTIYALDAAEAARRFVERMERDFPDNIGDEQIVVVRGEDGKTQRFAVF